MPSIIRHIFRATVAELSVALCIGALGCTAAQQRRAQEKDASIHEEDIKVTAEQLRLRMRSLVGPMCGQIEQSADAIMEGTPDLNLKLAALEWKMDAVPAMREALFRPGPYTAAVDTAVLCYQMTDYFESGPGKQEFGAASKQAAADCRRMTDDYFKVLASGTISGDVSKGRAFAQKWAADHPIRHSISGRESALARVFEQEFTDSRAATEYIANAAATADDLARKMDVYSDQLFHQAQWEVERVQFELVRDYHVDQAMPLAQRAVASAERATVTVDRLDPALERSLSIAQDAPRMVAAEREAVIKALHEEVDSERRIAFKDLHDALSDQAKQLTNDADEIATRKIDYVMERVTRLSVVIAAVVAVLLIVLLMRRIIARPRGATVAGRSLLELQPPRS